MEEESEAVESLLCGVTYLSGAIKHVRKETIV
jgi:hypothetical protein